MMNNSKDKINFLKTRLELTKKFKSLNKLLMQKIKELKRKKKQLKIFMLNLKNLNLKEEIQTIKLKI